MDFKEGLSQIQKFSSGWLIGRSKKHNGQIYYFNTLTGDAVWNLSDAEIEKAKKATRKLESIEGSKILDECPEPKGPPVFEDKIQKYNTEHINLPSTSRDTNTQIINNKFIQPFNPFNAILCSPCIGYTNPNAMGLNIAPPYNPNIWNMPPQQIYLTNHMIGQSGNLNNIGYSHPDSGITSHSESLSNRFAKLNKREEYQPNRSNTNRKQYRNNNKQQYRQNKFQHSPIPDLRNVLIAKRRNSQCETTSQLSVSQKEQEYEEQVMSKEVSCQQTEEVYRNEYNDSLLEDDMIDSSVNKCAIDVAPLKELASEHCKTEKWYLVADTDVYLNNLNYLIILFNSDPQCHLMVPPIIMSELNAVQGGNSKLLNWARLASSFLEKQINAGYAVIGKDGLSNVKNLQILRSCKSLVDENYHVVLISNDITLKSYRLQKDFPIFTMSEVKDYLLDGTKRPIEKFIEIIIPNNMRSNHESLTKSSESDKHSSAEANKIEEYNNEVTKTLENTNKCSIDACIQTDFTLPKTKVSEDYSNSITKKVHENSQTNSTSDSVPKPNRKIRLKRNISVEPITETNERRGFKWRRRRVGTLPSNNNVSSSNTTPALNDESNVRNICSEAISHNDVELKIMSENSESSTIQNSSMAKENTFVEETSTSDIISNSESCVNSDINVSWLRTNSNNSAKTLQESHENREIDMFVVRDETMAEYLKMKIDEWVSRFVQIMEEVLTEILQLDPPFVSKNLPPPWTIHEATECVKRKFEDNKDVLDAACKLSETLFNVSNTTGRIRKCLKPSEYMEMYSYGVNLVIRLQVLFPNCEDLQTAVESLSNILRDIQDPNMGLGNNDSFIDTQEISLNMSAANFSIIEKEQPSPKSTSPIITTTPLKKTTPFNTSPSKSPPENTDTTSELLAQSPVKLITKNNNVADEFFNCLQLQKLNNTQKSDFNSTNYDFACSNDNSQSVNCLQLADSLDLKSNGNFSSNELPKLISQPNTIKIVRQFTKNALYEKKLKSNAIPDIVDYDSLDYMEDEYNDDKKEVDYERMPFEYDIDPMAGVVVIDKQFDDDKIHEDINFPNDIKIDRTKDVTCNNNKNMKWVFGRIVNEVKSTLLKTRGFCKETQKLLKENGGVSKHRLKVKCELVKKHLESLCESLKSSIDQKSFAPNRLRDLLMSCGLDITNIDEKDSVAYRTVISKCHDQAYILLEVVNILIDTVSETNSRLML